jgi:hypothetical protein
MVATAAERQAGCKSCGGKGFTNKPLEGRGLRDAGFEGPMVFCQCVKPTKHDYSWATGGVGGREWGRLPPLPEPKHGVRLPSEKRAITKAHNDKLKADKKAAEEAKKGPQQRAGGFYGTPGVRDHG